MLKMMAQQKLGSTSKTQPSRKVYCRGPTPVCCCASHPTGKLAESSQLRSCSNKCRGWLLISSRESLKTLRGTKTHPIPGWKIIPCQAWAEALPVSLGAGLAAWAVYLCKLSSPDGSVEGRKERKWSAETSGEGTVLEEGSAGRGLSPHPNSYS